MIETVAVIVVIAYILAIVDLIVIEPRNFGGR